MTTDSAQATEVFEGSPRTRVVRSIRRWIDQGAIGSGERLPAERELATRLEVSRPTVRAALQQLGEQGLIRTTPTGARVVTSKREENGTLRRTLAVLSNLPDEPARDQRQQGWSSHLLVGAAAAVGRSGMHLMSLHRELLGGEALHQLIADRPFGVIIIRETMTFEAGRTAAEALREAGIPVVLHGYPAELPEYDVATSDHAAGGYALTKWMIQQGRRRILPFWDTHPDLTGREWVKQREEGYRRAMAEAGLEALPVVRFPAACAAGSTPADAAGAEDRFSIRARMTAGFLAEHVRGNTPVDAILAIADSESYAVTRACRLLGREPGRDVLIGGYDNKWQDAGDRAFEPYPPAVTVDKFNARVGEEMVDLVLARARGELSSEPQCRLIDPGLVVIKSD